MISIFKKLFGSNSPKEKEVKRPSDFEGTGCLACYYSLRGNTSRNIKHTCSSKGRQESDCINESGLDIISSILDNDISIDTSISNNDKSDSFEGFGGGESGGTGSSGSWDSGSDFSLDSGGGFD
jgi:uncharacterized membrane protein YgcG